MTEVTITLRQDDVTWLRDMLEDEYPNDEELLEDYLEVYERLSRIMPALQGAVDTEARRCL